MVTPATSCLASAATGSTSLYNAVYIASKGLTKRSVGNRGEGSLAQTRRRAIVVLST